MDRDPPFRPARRDDRGAWEAIFEACDPRVVGAMRLDLVAPFDRWECVTLDDPVARLVADLGSLIAAAS